MKKLLFLVSISILFFSSCIPNPTEDPDPPVIPFASYFRADYNDQTFTPATTQAVVNESYIAITAMKNTGEFFQITLPRVEEGTYTLHDTASNPLLLAFSQGSGNVPYMAARDDEGTYADFPSYVDTAELVIADIDTVHKTIIGTFKFTGVRFGPGGTTIDTKVFTNGAFALNYLDEPPPTPGNNTFTAKLDGVDFVPTSITGVSVSSTGRLTLVGRKGSIENIGLTLINTITPGTYTLGSSGDYVAQYIHDDSPEAASFAAETGTITIITHDTTAQRITGTFAFTATSPIVPGVSYVITEGAFDITYLD